MTIGVTQLDSSPSPGPYPVSSVIPTGTSVPKALEGGPVVADTDQKAPASIWIKDGNNVAQGATTSAAATDSTSAWSIVALLKGLYAKLAGTLTVGGSVSVSNFPATQPVSGTFWQATQPTQDIEQANYIAATTPPSATNAGSDTAYTFSSQVNRVIIQNNTSANVSYAFDVAASAGALVLSPGSTLVYPKKCTVLHLFTAAAQNINGTTAGNIVVLGAL